MASKTLQTISQLRPVPRRYIQISGTALAVSGRATSAAAWRCACSVLAASSLAMVTPSCSSPEGTGRLASASRKNRRAAAAQVVSVGERPDEATARAQRGVHQAARLGREDCERLGERRGQEFCGRRRDGLTRRIPTAVRRWRPHGPKPPE